VTLYNNEENTNLAPRT